ncbi:sulfotransferase domain-containing protein [Xanthobacter versatilis]|uniref:sulfotransferase domain-containing protein n=1 Tax=Xanthobacter autotrophicus (strain ATCC BAA-1158 / Py2) TaxID=78245 RepID=UPI00372B2E9B
MEFSQKSCVFVTTPTSGTGSLWRLLTLVSKDVLASKKIAEEYEGSGRGGDLPTWTPDGSGFLYMYNTPNLFNSHILDPEIRIITNFRDPRDLLCNQYHWVFQHPMAGKTEEQMEARRCAVREKGIDGFVREADIKPLYASLKKLEPRIKSGDKNTLVLSYRQLCNEFDTLVDRVCQFFRVNREEVDASAIELERTTNLIQNPDWIGQVWSGTDVMPGRYLNELSEDCIEFLNEKYADELSLIERIDPPRATVPELKASDTLCRQVLFGKRGNLFLKNDSNRVIDQVSGRMRLPFSTSINIAQAHAARRRFGGTIGNFSYHHAVIPMKEVVCRRDLPDGIRFEEYGQRPILQYLTVGSTIWRPYYEPAVLEGDEDVSFFPKRDTHWNHDGALRYFTSFLAASAPELLSRIERVPMRRFPTRQRGDLGGRLQEPDDEIEIVAPNGLPINFEFDNGISNEGRVRVSRNAAGVGRAIVFHDSFGDWLLNFAASMFSEVTFLHGNVFDYEMVLSLRPNYIFCFQTERFFARIPENGVSAFDYIEKNEREKNSKTRYSDWMRSV